MEQTEQNLISVLEQKVKWLLYMVSILFLFSWAFTLGIAKSSGGLVLLSCISVSAFLFCLVKHIRAGSYAHKDEEKNERK